MLLPAQGTMPTSAGALCLFQANLPSVHISSYFLAIPTLLHVAFLVFCIYLFYHTKIRSPFLICQHLCYLANHHPLSSFSYALHSGSITPWDAPLSPRFPFAVVNPKGNYEFPRYAIEKVSGLSAFFCVYHRIWL